MAPSLNANNKPSWNIRSAFKRINPFASRIDPELYEQEQGGPKMTRYGIVKAVGGKFGEFDGGNQFVIERPGAGTSVNPEKALANNRGFVFASVNAIAREVMTIDWRLFEVNGKNHKEKLEHEVLDLLDTVNDNMIGLAFKYLLSACLTLTGNCYVYLQDVKTDLDKPKAIHLMPPDRVRPVIDRRSWPYQLVGYKMKLENLEMVFKPYEVIHLQLPNPANFFEGMSPVSAGAEYIDNDNYAQEFNRKFFRNGARPSGFLETQMVAETQIEALKLGFAAVHEGIDNMNRIGVLPKDVKWAPTGSSPKDMDFKNLSEDSKERILAMFGVSRTILGTAESDTNRACYDDQTEVLTENGWKKYYEVKDGEKIAEYDGKKNIVRFAKPLGKYVYPYKGKMLHFENCKMDIMVTPDHRMWYRPDHKGAKYRIALADKIPKIAYFKAAAPQDDGKDVALFNLPYYEKGSHHENKSRNFMMDDWLEFLGYVISEGGVSSLTRNRVITLYQKKLEQQMKIQSCLEQMRKSGCMNYGWYRDNEDPEGLRFNIYGPPLIFWMHDHIGAYANEKHLPDFVWKLSRRQRRILFDALMVGDGSIDPRENRKSGYYSTTSHQLADDVQRLALSLGIQSHADIHYEAFGNRNTCYRVMFDFGSTEQQLDWQHRDMRHEVDYDGVVWCFKTTTGLFVTRRNGKIALQGNTAETADYVFSKRVVRPHMLLICAYLNERLIPRYGDKIYLSFIDPVPEDRAARTDEMSKASGGVPIITQNEAREEFMGLGPVDGGDALLIPNTMTPSGEPTQDGNIDPASQSGPAKAVAKQIPRTQRQKAANGERVAFRPSRLKLQRRAKQRQEMSKSLAEKIVADLKVKFKNPTKKFATTKEQDETKWKEFSEYTHAAEKEIAETLRTITAEQKKEVMEHLPGIVQKAINPADLFDIEKWISITTDALTPIMDTLFEHQARAAAADIGKPELNPFNDTTRAAVKRSVQMMSESYNQTTLNALESRINDGLSAGESLPDITKRVEEVYDWTSEKRAAMVAKTESFRTANGALKEAWQQSGVVKTLKWYTANNPCPFCKEMDGKIISIDDNFFDNGDSLTVGEGDNAQSMSLDYGDVSTPPLHPNCMCFVRPEDVSID